MTTSYICSYVHYRKLQNSLQGSVGSFIRRDGPCGGVVWKGRAGDLACGGTQKNRACHTLLMLGSEAALSTPTWHCVAWRGRARPASGGRRPPPPRGQPPPPPPPPASGPRAAGVATPPLAAERRRSRRL